MNRTFIDRTFHGQDISWTGHFIAKAFHGHGTFHGQDISWTVHFIDKIFHKQVISTYSTYILKIHIIKRI